MDADLEALQKARKLAQRYKCGAVVAACSQFQLHLHQPLPSALLHCAAIGLTAEESLHLYLESSVGASNDAAESTVQALDSRALLQAAQQLGKLFKTTLGNLAGGSIDEDEQLLKKLQKGSADATTQDACDRRRKM